MKQNGKGLAREIEVLKSLHLAWAALSKTKRDCEEGLWPFCGDWDSCIACFDGCKACLQSLINYNEGKV